MPKVGCYFGVEDVVDENQYREHIRTVAYQNKTTESQITRAALDIILGFDSPPLIADLRKELERKINAPCDNK